jgi:peroxiredoxin Q/BCP
MKLGRLFFALMLAACTPAAGTTAPSTAATSAPDMATSPGSPAPAAAMGASGATSAAAASASPASAAAMGASGAGTAGAADALVGTAAPDFSATAQNGTRVHLAALKGKPVVVYFYPKDETPGCTKEACSFRDAWQPLGKTGAVLVGISADTLDSHKGFADHWKLPFLLVSDPDGAIGKLYGVPFQGVHKRQTIVIGPDGKITKVYRSVDVSMHAQEILNDLNHLS